MEALARLGRGKLGPIRSFQILPFLQGPSLDIWEVGLEVAWSCPVCLLCFCFSCFPPVLCTRKPKRAVVEGSRVGAGAEAAAWCWAVQLLHPWPGPPWCCHGLHTACSCSAVSHLPAFPALPCAVKTQSSAGEQLLKKEL